MPKRRLSEKQKRHIRTIQERRRERLALRAEQVLETSDEEAAEREGEVISRYGANLAVRDERGQLFHCLSRQNIGEVVCGDRVVWKPIDTENGVVTARLDRHTVLSRPDYAGRDKALAANITQLIIVLAPEPEPGEYLVDQYLVAAETIGVKTAIAVNKTDLLSAEQLADMDSRFEIYARIGYPYLKVNSRTPEGVAPLAAILRNEISILVGQSGVGKSSLINALLPDRDIQTGKLSKATGFGRHTTTATTSYVLPAGGQLIDSPGVRSFRLGQIEPGQLAQGFREFRPHLGQCRFSNCRHREEPECALKDAVAEGKISGLRLKHFLHMADNPRP